jgi:hypothetical protein
MISMKYIFSLIGILLFMAQIRAATAGDINGKWIAVYRVDIELDFKVKGSKLKGMVSHPLVGDVRIQKGKIDGDIVSFIVMREDGSARAAWKGKIDGEVIHFTVVDSLQRVMKMDAVRPKAASPGQTSHKTEL